MRGLRKVAVAVTLAVAALASALPETALAAQFHDPYGEDPYLYSVSVPTELPCAVMADGTIVAPSLTVTNNGIVPLVVSDITVQNSDGCPVEMTLRDGDTVVAHRDAGSADGSIIDGNRLMTIDLDEKTDLSVDLSASGDDASALFDRATNGPISLFDLVFSVSSNTLTGSLLASGTPAVGQTLTATPDGFPAHADLSYQWYREFENTSEDMSVSMVSDADTSIGTVNVPVSGSTVTISLSATYSGGFLEALTSQSFKLVNTDTGEEILTYGDGGFFEPQTSFEDVPAGSYELFGSWSNRKSGVASLTVTNVSVTCDGEATAIDGADAATWVVDEASVGANVYCEVTDASGAYVGTVRSNTLGPVRKLPAITGTLSITGKPLVGETITATASDVPSDATLGYQWMRSEGAEIVPINEDLPMFSPIVDGHYDFDADPSNTLKALTEITVKNDGDSVQLVYGANSEDNGGSPLPNGNDEVFVIKSQTTDTLLSAHQTTNLKYHSSGNTDVYCLTIENVPAGTYNVYAYRNWFNSGGGVALPLGTIFNITIFDPDTAQPIEGETATTHVFSDADSNEVIWCEAVDTNGAYTGKLVSNCIGPSPDAEPPEPEPLTGSVTVTGTPNIGETLVANVSGLPEGAEPQYQWYRTDVTGSDVHYSINGATSSTYDIGSDVPVSTFIWCEVTDASGNYVGTLESNHVGPVLDAPDPLTGSLSISGGLYVGNTLTVTGTGLPNDADMAYTWYRSVDADTQSFEDTLVPQGSDVSNAPVLAHVSVSRPGEVVNVMGSIPNQSSGAVGDEQWTFAVTNTQTNATWITRYNGRGDGSVITATFTTLPQGDYEVRVFTNFTSRDYPPELVRVCVYDPASREQAGTGTSYALSNADLNEVVWCEGKDASGTYTGTVTSRGIGPVLLGSSAEPYVFGGYLGNTFTMYLTDDSLVSSVTWEAFKDGQPYEADIPDGASTTWVPTESGTYSVVGTVTFTNRDVAHVYYEITVMEPPFSLNIENTDTGIDGTAGFRAVITNLTGGPVTWRLTNADGTSELSLSDYAIETFDDDGGTLALPVGTYRLYASALGPDGSTYSIYWTLNSHS